MCNAQSDSTKSLFWVSPTAGSAEFLSAILSIGYEPRNTKSVFIGRYLIAGELLNVVDPGMKTKELGLLYGVKFGRLRAALGISSVWGNRRGAYLFTDPDPLWGTGMVFESLPYRTVGIPAELRYRFVTKYIGIGLTAFGTYNKIRSFGGLGVSLYMGRLK